MGWQPLQLTVNIFSLRLTEIIEINNHCSKKLNTIISFHRFKTGYKYILITEKNFNVSVGNKVSISEF